MNGDRDVPREPAWNGPAVNSQSSSLMNLKRSRVSGKKRWIVLAVWCLLGFATSGLTGVAYALFTALLVVGVWVGLTGRAGMLFGGRKQGGGAVVTALIALAVTAIVSPPPVDELGVAAVDPSPTTVAEKPAPEPAVVPVPIPVPAPTSNPTPEPSPTLEAEPEPEPEPVAEAEPVSAVESAEQGTALAALALLEVKGRAPKTGYDRDLFAYRAVDLDRNGCDTRNDILRRDLDQITTKHDTGGCVVETGTLDDPYSGKTLPFVRGQSTSSDVQIDHVVAMSDAWQKGAQSWGKDTLQSFGNNPLNMLAVDGPLNSQKGAGDTATWLPPNKPFRCAYVARQVAVKVEYELWVTQAEYDAMERVLTACPDELLPESAWDIPLTPELAAAAPAPEPAPPATAPVGVVGSGGGSSGLDERFSSCKKAIAEGLGRYTKGVHPEYDWYRDADKDGVVCER